MTPRRPAGVSDDQVPRLEQFRAAHPDIEIMSPLDARSSPWWKAYRKDGEPLATGVDLRRLLDVLDVKLGEEGSES
jgi:hypothetical protein